MHTPWGPSQHTKTVLDGILWVSTASHGGLMLDRAAAATLPANIRSAGMKSGAWLCFEEDCACGLVFEARIDVYRAFRTSTMQDWQKHVDAPYRPEYAKDAEEIIAKIGAELALSDAELIAQHIAPSNREWFPELFGLGPRCWTCRKLNCAGHANELIAYAATSLGVPAGLVGVYCCYGGRDQHGKTDNEEHRYLIPREEYNQRETYFIVDPAHHTVWV